MMNQGTPAAVRIAYARPLPGMPRSVLPKGATLDSCGPFRGRQGCGSGGFVRLWARFYGRLQPVGPACRAGLGDESPVRQTGPAKCSTTVQCSSRMERNYASSDSIRRGRLRCNLRKAWCSPRHDLDLDLDLRIARIVVARSCSWKVATAAGLFLACIASSAVYWSYEPKYEASALIEINEHSPYLIFEPHENVSMACLRTQLELIRSRWIIGRAIDNERIKQIPEILKQPDPIEWLRKSVIVVQAPGSNLFEIKFSCNNAENAALVVNTVTEQYLAAQEDERKRNATARSLPRWRSRLSLGRRP